MPAGRSTGFRASVERASMPTLTWLATLPGWLPSLVMMLLILVGALVGGPVGLVMVAIALAALLWLLYLSWPQLTPPLRLMRIAVLALVVAVIVTRFVPG
jgi:hypothetical protein